MLEKNITRLPHGLYMVHSAHIEAKGVKGFILRAIDRVRFEIAKQVVRYM